MHHSVVSAFCREITKIASSKKEKESGSIIPLRRSIAVGSLGSFAAHQGLNALANKSIEAGRALDAKEIAEFTRHMKTEVPDVRHIVSPPLFHSGGPAYFPDDKVIYSPRSAHPAILAHEIGHAQGMGKHLSKYLGPITHLSALPGLATLGTLVAAKKWAQKGKTTEERDNRLKKLQIMSAVGGAGALPQLAEEARASLNAINLGRRVGKGGEYARHLLPAFGTYAVTPVALTAATMYGLHRMRKANKKEPKAGEGRK